LFEVKSVDPKSAAGCCGLQKGDIIVTINGDELIDYVDYIYFCSLKKINVKVRRSGLMKTFNIKKSEEDDLGISFTEPLLGASRVCANKCVFCFVDQLPKGMRKSLYLKDEDWRYSLIMGNFVTLSSISEADIDRIIKRKASPFYISVHTVNEDLRQQMLGSPNALPIKPMLKKLSSHGIRFHAQVVICPGLNDGERLEETLRFLKKLHPAAVSLAIVPVGLTAFRDGLAGLKQVTKADAEEIIKRVEYWQKECLNRIHTRFVFAADELYIRAGRDFPPVSDYEGFPQIENGVGLLPEFLFEAASALADCGGSGRHVSIATGEDAYPFFKAIAEKVRSINIKADVYKVKNMTFGGGVTVSGLLTGKDFLSALSEKDLGETLLITADALNGDMFLDDMKLSELEKKLNVKIIPVTDGYSFAEMLCRGGA